MAYNLNSKIRDLKPYDPILGDFPIRLDANESFLQPTDEILTKIRDAAASVVFNRYPDPFAKELCQSFADFYGVDEASVTAGNGSDELISVILGAFVMKDEAIMTLSPDFSMYRFYGHLNEVKCFEYQKKADFSIDLDELISLTKEYDIKALVFSNPCNPTGRGLKREEVRKLVASVNALVVLDEAYMDFWDQSFIREAGNYDNLIVLRTCSKMIGMAALRLGFAVANPSITNAIRAVKSPYNVNACSQKIGSIVLKEKSWLDSGLSEIKASRKELSSMLKFLEQIYCNQIHVYDSVTNFILVRVLESRRVFEGLKKAGIVVRHMGDYIRITAGTAEENMKLIRCLKTIL
ncbi:Histidinol-phosphate aminotransferase [Caprobacter fermentans]|uniref:Histidinol-phosphate aminotransferase n=1 Tax=Caproicibacter fermentans TaxID=2576756 RepID=A0A6N8I1K3_9FIRM|nr:histidinol-phosphate transaminase [Caproicibacter fermentans]MVB11922.1 Histidinol-phosphate aminotransferase [Caproicibacter fermentans]OCM99845.1 histidinol-phosphate transaminase [Clostridium sp. W14A]